MESSPSTPDPSRTSADNGLPVEVREIQDGRDQDRFLRLPWKIYHDDPAWVPPLLVDVKEFIDPKAHPFHQHGSAVCMIALRDGETVGRILVSDDPNFNARHGTNLGCFGMFECIDDETAAGAMLDAAADWLRDRGRDVVRGPIDYSVNYPCGLLIDGFDTPPRIMMNHGRPYYARLIESWGLKKVKDLYAWWFVDRLDMMKKWRRRIDWLTRRASIKIRPFDLSDFDAEVERCHTVYDAARKNNWGFVELTDAEFTHLAQRLRRYAHPKLILVAEADGQPVGFSITLPDLNEAIRPLNGRLTTFGLPFGLVRLLYRMRHVKTGRMAVLVVAESHRRRGVAELLIHRTLDQGMGVVGYSAAELGWTLEDNEMINRAIEHVGGDRYKTYRIFEKPISSSRPAIPTRSASKDQ